MDWGRWSEWIIRYTKRLKANLSLIFLKTSNLFNMTKTTQSAVATDLNFHFKEIINNVFYYCFNQFSFWLTISPDYLYDWGFLNYPETIIKFWCSFCVVVKTRSLTCQCSEICRSSRSRVSIPLLRRCRLQILCFVTHHSISIHLENSFFAS